MALWFQAFFASVDSRPSGNTLYLLANQSIMKVKSENSALAPK